MHGDMPKENRIEEREKEGIHGFLHAGIPRFSVKSELQNLDSRPCGGYGYEIQQRMLAEQREHGALFPGACI